MRRKLIVSALALACVAVGLVVWQSSGQNPGRGEAKAATLPIRQVVLFNSGVSYVQREGEVDGNAQVDLPFPTSDINDLLKSLILEDLGKGKFTSVNYDSHDPLDKILRSFALDLNSNPTFAQILNQARGEKIEIVRQEKKDEKPKTFAGTIVGVEVQRKAVGKDNNIVEVEMLNLSGDNGLQSVALDQVTSVRFLNPVLESEFQRALRVLASSHDTQKKTVSLSFSGVGKRTVRVGYVVEHPIWKTSYRVSLEPDGKVYIQGWAIVENTSDDDWNDVNMTLVSGRPISFKMDLYDPLYIPRPTVEPELFASLRPPVYSGGLMGGEADKATAAAPQAPVPGQRFQGQGLGGMPGMGMMGGGGFPGGGQNFGPGNNQNKRDQQGQEIQQFNQQNLNKLTFEQLQERQKESRTRADAKKVGEKLTSLNFKEGVATVASADELGDYYQYTIDHKISLPRQKSAMLLILHQTIEGAKVSIYNESVQAKFPLLGLRLKNSSKLPLNQGPITVYEDNSYVGDTRILDVQPKEERLLSYALDQSTEVKSDVKTTPSPDMHFKVGEGVLTAKYKLRQTKTYTIKNRAAKERTVILEHPIRTDWKLADGKKPKETARDVYRFEVHVPAEKTITYDVVEDQARSDNVALSGQPAYVATTGIQIKTLINVSEEKLMSLKIQKGFLLPTLKARESKTYVVQNYSDLDRVFSVDHIVRAGWVRLADQGEVQRGPDVFHFELKVPLNKTASREIIEERTHQEKGLLVKNVPEERLREYLANSAPSPDVKVALNKVLTMTAKIAETARSLAEQEKQLKQLSDDQARLRENLKIIPQSAEPYKKFLDKFVAQETEIDGFQKQIRQLQVTLQTQQRDLDVFVAALTVE